MSELKDYDIMDIEAMDDERLKTESAPGKWVPKSRVYLKSEADKVIAEKDKELRHQKYKRGLAMASLWLERSETSTDLENELVSRKRCNKWLELAEKFKEAK